MKALLFTVIECEKSEISTHYDPYFGYMALILLAHFYRLLKILESKVVLQL